MKNPSADSQATVTVLMPAYNAQTYIGEALDSLISQSLEDWECVIVNDASTDGTLDIIRRYAERDPRFIILENETNLGVTGSLNFALSKANGPFIARFDSDDVMQPSRLEKLLHILQTRPEIDLVGSDSLTIDESGTTARRVHQISVEKLIYFSMRYYNPILHCWVCRRSFYDQLEGYRDVRGAEDFDLIVRGWIRGARYASVREPLIKIRRHGSNISRIQASSQSASRQFVTRQARSKVILPFTNSEDRATILLVNEKWIATRHFWGRALLILTNPLSAVVKEIVARKFLQGLEFLFRVISRR